MKRSKKMILMLCALAILVGGYFGVKQLNQTESVSETAGTFDLTAKTMDDLTGLSWTKDDAVYAFTYANDTWSTTDQPAWPVQQSAVQAMADSLLGLQGTHKLEDVKNPADYGLETPAFSVTAAWKDGSSTTYNMGDATPFADGYYLSLSGQEGTIYTIASSLSSTFDKSQKDMVAMETIPAVADVAEMSVGDSFHAVKLSESKTVDPDQFWYDAQTEQPLDSSKVETLISDAGNISWENLVTANADETSLKEWQLDDEQAVTVKLVGEDGAATILLGIIDENSHYYARLPDSFMVYTVASEDVSGLLTASAEDMRIKAILPMPYEQLAEATFTIEKGEYRLVKPAAEATEETDSPEDEETMPDGTAEASEASETDKAEETLWQMVSALEADGTPETEQTGDQILRIHAVSVSGMETTVVICEYSADSYQAVVDGGAPLLVPADDIDSLVRAVRTRQ
ncbi:MAG: DUF4340 domain-containing protein [Clostridia bacterium]|nr:DUF4340 domain-containing protein [Clostridia bacterium]MBR1710419.1 DUF4340 domain-containing protein [Clostridia bacterium]